MSVGSNACPICGSTPRPLYTIDRFSPPFAIERCDGCGLQRQTQIPDSADEHYAADYYTGRSEYSYRDERAQRQFDLYVQNARLKNIARCVPTPADFVDVGAAFGAFVEAAGDFGFRARGLDVSQYAVDDARARGLDLSVGELEPGVLAPNSVDVLTMIEVFEHITRPRLAMQALREAIRPGGLVVIQTANFLGRQAQTAGADYHYYLPGHFHYYSSANLRQLFREFGCSRSRVYRPVDFGLLAKLQKSRGGFRTARDYLKWLRIAWYHWQGLLHWGDWSLTSSMVFYAWRDAE